MQIIEILREQHDLILEQLAVLEDLAGRSAPDVGAAGRLLDFLVQFADEQHHATEEGELFPALLAAGPHSPGPVEVMLAEHEQGRAYIRDMRQALARSDWAGFGAGARNYTSLLRNHIAKENEVLFRIAERLLGRQAS